MDTLFKNENAVMYPAMSFQSVCL